MVPADGAPVDGASCTGGAPLASLLAAGSIGPLSTLDSPRPGFGWTFVGPNVGDAGPVVAFDDESELAWSGDLPPSAQPYVQQAAGDPPTAPASR
jgi:hypothetical protein